MTTRHVDSATRLNCSINGNPRFRVHFSDGSSAITKSDAGCSYEVTNAIGKDVEVTFTRAGRIKTLAIL